jgi:hypothetical protein
MINLPQVDDDYVVPNSLWDESLFLINYLDPWYGDILMHLQTMWFVPHLCKDDHRHVFHQMK